MSEGHHFIPFKVYLNVFIGLLILTVVTVAVAKPVSGFDAGIFNAAIAMFIASIKAGLVAGYFMELKYDKKLHLGILLISIFFLLLMFGFCWVDIISRHPVSSTL